MTDPTPDTTPLDEWPNPDTGPDTGPAAEPVNLPAPIGGADGQLDVDAMRHLAPQVRTGLVAALRHAAQLARSARGTVVVAEDTYPLVRGLTDAGEVLRTWASAFSAAAAEADALVAEEALAVAGAEADGTLLTNLYVPDGLTSRIAVRADWKAGTSTWDVPSLIGWLIDDEVANLNGERRAERRRAAEARQAAADPNAEGVEPEPLDPVNIAAELAYYEVDVRSVAHEVVLRLLALGTYSPAASKVEALRKRLAGLGRDAEAAIIRQVRSVGPREYRGVKVTREVVEP